jgi:hypothetical protein
VIQDEAANFGLDSNKREILMIQKLGAVSPEVSPVPGSDGYSYHHDYSRVSASMLKVFMHSRREYEATFVTRTMEPEGMNKAMSVGDLCHAIILDNAAVDEHVLRYPEWCYQKNGRSLAGAWSSKVDGIVERLNGGEPLAEIAADKEYEKINDSLWEDLASRKKFPRMAMKDEDIDRCLAIVEVFRRQKWAKDLTESPLSIAEKDLFWVDQATGLECRCRPDFMIPTLDKTWFFDLKITINWTPEDFDKYLSGRRFGGQRGWVQAMHYSNGIETLYGNPSEMRFICLNPQYPHQVCVNELPDNLIDECRRQYRKIMTDVAECKLSGNWADTSEGVRNFSTIGPWDLV